MGAMLVGMATGFAAMGIIFVARIIFTIVISLNARRNKMHTLTWVFVSFLLGAWCLLIYIPIRVKISRLKCSECGTKIEKGMNFCANCGQAVNKIDDKKIVRKVLLWICIIWVAFVLLGTVWASLVG